MDQRLISNPAGLLFFLPLSKTLNAGSRAGRIWSMTFYVYVGGKVKWKIWQREREREMIILARLDLLWISCTSSSTMSSVGIKNVHFLVTLWLLFSKQVNDNDCNNGYYYFIVFRCCSGSSLRQDTVRMQCPRWMVPCESFTPIERSRSRLGRTVCCFIINYFIKLSLDSIRSALVWQILFLLSTFLKFLDF